MDYMSPNNMPPVVSPAATHGMPNMMPNMMPHVNVVDVHTKTENIYMYPYPKKPVYNDFALVLVLFILLVIILRGVHHHHHGGKC